MEDADVHLFIFFFSIVASIGLLHRKPIDSKLKYVESYSQFEQMNAISDDYLKFFFTVNENKLATRVKHTPKSSFRDVYHAPHLGYQVKI